MNTNLPPSQTMRRLAFTRHGRGVIFLFVLILLAGSLVSSAAGQAHSLETNGLSPFSNLHPFGTGRDNTRIMVTGDMDADGDLDIIVGNYSQPGAVYLNDGNGFFSTVSGAAWYFGGEPDDIAGLAVGDMDGDGDLDIITGNDGGQNRVYINDGSGFFSDIRNFGSGTDPTRTVGVGDFDGDGDLDIIAGNLNQQTLIHLNNGQGFFTGYYLLSASPHDINSVALGDLDRDGDLDIVTGNAADPNVVYLNDGSGNYPSSYNFGAGGFMGKFLSLGDCNGDGYLDIVEIEYFTGGNVYLNDRSGHFVFVGSFGQNERFDGASLGDIDQDGDLDVIAGNTFEPNSIYYNNGSGMFLASQVYASGSQQTASVAVADMDGDGDLDVLNGNWLMENAIYLNDLPVNFQAAGRYGPAGVNSYAVALGDVDRDGDLDAAAVQQNGQNLVYLNNGAGNFRSEVNFGSGEQLLTLAFGDLDGDFDLDIVAGTNSGGKLFLNDGAGNYANSRSFGLLTTKTTTLALGDIDGDRDLDIVAGNFQSQNAIYLNDGWGNFYTGEVNCTDPRANVRCIGTGNTATNDIVLGDVDNDGDLDILVANDYWLYAINPGSAVYFNDVGGNFPDRQEIGAWDDSIKSIALGDLNNDGYLDLVAGVYGGQSLLYLNNGTGKFTPGSALPTGLDRILDVALGDIDNDGDLDIFTVASDTTPTTIEPGRILINDGLARFTSIWSFGIGAEVTRRIAVGDLDGNGSLDILTANNGQPNIFLNRTTAQSGLPAGNFFIDASRPANTTDADFLSAPEILITQEIGLQYWVYNPLGNPLGNVEITYSLNGGGAWQTAASINTATSTIPADYSYRDSEHGRDPEFTWIEIAGIGNPVYLQDESYAGPFSLGFPFPFHDNMISSLWIHSNGGLTFSDHGSSLPFLNTCIPSHVNLYEWIFPFWEDLDPGAGGQVRYLQIDDRLVVEFYQVPGYGGTGVYTFEVILAADGSVTFQYLAMDGVLDGATIGIQLNGKRAFQIACNSSYAQNNLAGRFRRGTRNWFTWDTFASGFFGQSDNVVLRLTTNAQLEGTGIPGRYTYPNQAPGPFIHPYASVTTFPFRVRGTQVRVEPNALLFNGANDFIDIPDSPSLDLTDELTLEAWVNLGNPQRDQKIAGKTPIWSGYLLGVQYGNLYPEVWDSAGNRYTFYAGEIPPDTWTHLAVTWKSGGLMIGYVNGNQVMSIPASANPIGVNDNPLRIGKAPWGEAFTVAGMIDDVRIWRTAKSQPDIQRDMYRKHTGDEPNLVGYWPFEEHAGGIVYDLTPNDNNGLLGEGIAAYQPDWVSSFQAGSAHVYRLAHPDVIAEPMGGYDIPFTANLYGYLSGRGILNKDDKIVALAPIYKNDTLTLYHTSASPNSSGLELQTVQVGGVQSLEVSGVNPFILFNLDTSLEWDASQDTRFQEQLRYNLQRTSQLLFDWSNGQVALGNVRVFHNRQNWNEVHLRIYASNRLRPNADLGGVVLSAITETVLTPRGENSLLYQPGQVRIGPSWNRFGDEEGTLGEDWPRALAHELSHYLFFFDDNYLGLDENTGLVFPIYSCPGAMTDPYRDDDSARFDEFHSKDEWDIECAQTLSNQVTGRSDWETLQTFYPELNAAANDGPNSLPLAVTQVLFQPINSTPLEAPVFNLVNESGNRYLASSRARAFLIQQDHIIDLGRPQSDFILALGSTIGDTLCIYDEPNHRQGCQQITDGSEQVYLTPIINWTPDIIVTPVTSDTFKVEVSNLTSGLNLTAELFSDDDPPTIEKQLSYSNGAYSTIFIDLPNSVLGGFIYLKDTLSGYSAINAFTIGGSPARIYSRAARIRSRAARIRSRAAPLVSGDGQVILYVDDLTFPEEEYYTFQTVGRLPSPLNWATPVGLAYRLTASPNAPVLSGVSISLSYLDADVPDGEESWLQIYFYDGVSWVPLETQVLTSENYAIASSRGRGIYMLMSSYRIELYEPGWSLISYPVNDSRLVEEALRSIEGKYSLVYGFYRLDEVARWQLYAPAAPDWLWDLIEPLSHLVFGRGYWIFATEATTLYLKGTQADQLSPDSFGGYPPAVYFGPVLPAENFSPAAGMIITAEVGGVVCGEGQTLEVNGEVVYAVQVQAEGFSSGSGCGLPGRVITFAINGQAMTQSPEWDNTRLWEVPLRPAFKVFLPSIRR